MPDSNAPAQADNRSVSEPAPAQTALAALWQGLGLGPEALAHAQLPGHHGVLASSFDVATAAQASLGAAALAAAEVGLMRDGGQRQTVSVDRSHAALACTGRFALDGRVPTLWEKYSGLYACGEALGQPGWVRIHANFAHHRDGALRLLGLPVGDRVAPEAVSAALRHWRAEDFEQAAADAGLVVAAARSFEQWDAHPQALALAGQPLVAVTPIAAVDGEPVAPPLPWPARSQDARPLAGLRVLDLTRILAGPVAGRCLAAYGAEVMLVNGPHLPNIAAIADTSRGKLSAQLDLRTAESRAQLRGLAASARVFLQGYRPGALAGQGFSASALARLRPGIVVASISAYGDQGPWGDRRGFDSLVQTATGFNLAEAQALGADQPPGAWAAEEVEAKRVGREPNLRPDLRGVLVGTPRKAGTKWDSSPPVAADLVLPPRLLALPMQILDFAAGQLLAFGISTALARQAHQGGSWQVKVSLAGVGAWLRSLGRVDASQRAPAAKPDFEPWLEDSVCGFGLNGAPATLRAMRHAAQFSATPARWARPSMPPGHDAPVWPAV